MKPRVIILSASKGVYLGSAMGLGFWTKLEDLGLDEAITFADEAQAMTHMQTWESWAELEKDFTFPGVHRTKDGFADHAACVAAGAPPWRLS